jgi:4a-hydroxytetrahydrobiopterin dehydratase
MSILSAGEVAAAELPDWVLLRQALHTRLGTKDFRTGLELVGLIGAAAETANHHPDLDLRYAYLDIHLSSHDVGGVTERDLALARTISELAARHGVVPEPHAVGGVH